MPSPESFDEPSPSVEAAVGDESNGNNGGEEGGGGRTDVGLRQRPSVRPELLRRSLKAFLW